MQSFVGGPGGASALLFVRAEIDVPMAVRAVNQLLSCRPRTEGSACDILGIVVRPCVDADLPSILADDGAQPAGDVALRESAGLSGLWSLCWFDFGMRDESAVRDDRRERLLALLSADPSKGEPSRPPRFIPVLTSLEEQQQAGRLVDALDGRFPGLEIERDCFVYEPTPRGLVRLAED